MKPKPGIYPGVSFDEYLSWDAVNNSLLSIMVNKSPAHAKAYMDNPPKQTDALRVGHAFHTRLLEPAKFSKRYAIRPECNRRTKAGKKIYKDFMASLNGKTELTQAEAESIEVMCKSVENKSFIHNYIERGDAEICIVWIDPQTKLLCKARLDYLQKRFMCIVDAKTTSKTAQYDDFSYEIADYNYHQQAAWYSDGLKVLKNEMPSFAWIVIEKQPPYECRLWEASNDIFIEGRRAYRKALKLCSKCLKTGNWPGYPDRVEMINLPRWAINKYEIQEIEDEKSDGQFIDWDALESEARQAEHTESRS